MSLGKAGSEKFAPAKSTINAVQNQLNNGFLPAVKHVAFSSQELLKAHHNLQKAAENHVAALKLLAESTKGAQPGAKRHALALERLLTDYEQLMDLHKHTITKLNFIATKTTVYSNGEKEKLKEMHDTHKKREKDYLKAEKKGEKSDEDLGKFYASEAKSFSTQQEMRYKFFVDKHVEWFDSFVPMTKFAQERMLPHEKEEEKKEEEHHHVEEAISNGIKEAVREEIKAVREEIIEEKLIEAVAAAIIEEKHHHDHEKELIEEKFDDHTVETHVELTEPENKQRSDYIEQAHQRGVAVQVLPVTALAGAKELKHVEPVPSLPSPVVHDPTPPPPVHYPVYIPPQPQHEQYRPAMLPVREDPPLPATAVIHHTSPVMISSPLVSPPPKPLPKPESPVSIPSQFGASDYGKILSVKQDFAASSGEQLTVNAGDKVVLIKSGNRGWIFIRDCVSQRTGWIPANYANL